MGRTDRRYMCEIVTRMSLLLPNLRDDAIFIIIIIIINTCSNVGTAGVGVYIDKVGVDFELKNINAADKLTVPMTQFEYN